MNLKREKRLWKKGYKRVIGIDEAGRGPLAGPVVAAAAMVNPKLTETGSLQVKDSKKLTPKKREEIYNLLIKDKNIEWGIGKVSERVIDRINILEATKLAMKRAVKNLERKLNKKVDYLILDGNIKISLDILQKSIKKADNKVFSCAAASIIAKVKRDRAMEKYHKKYPRYGFDKHKGYPTKFHKKMLKKYGFCKIHRKTFKPVKSLPK
jgi:ribonuclease HII